MGTFKGLKEVRRIIIDCMNNIHPIYRIKELMIRRELAKDPKLAGENWDRFLPSSFCLFRYIRPKLTNPEFQKKHLKTSEKTARKNAAIERQFDPADNPNSINIQPTPTVTIDTAPAPILNKPKKKTYTPFPPPQQPSKLDLQLASGEYFLKPEQKEAIEKRKREDLQGVRAATKRAEREEAFIAPPEIVGEKIGERKKKRKAAELGLNE